MDNKFFGISNLLVIGLVFFALIGIVGYFSILGNKDIISVSRDYSFIADTSMDVEGHFENNIDKLYFNKDLGLLEIEEGSDIKLLSSIELDVKKEVAIDKSVLFKESIISGDLRDKYSMHISAAKILDGSIHFRGAPLSNLADENFYVENYGHLKVIETDIEIENSDFALEGFYVDSNEFVCYVSLLGSLIFVFDKGGSFLYSFNTIDNSGIPKVIVSYNGYRRHAADVNVVSSSAAIEGIKLYVLSNIRDDTDFKSIDVYSLEDTGRYLYSIRVVRNKKGYMASKLAVKGDSLYLTFFKEIVLSVLVQN